VNENVKSLSAKEKASLIGDAMKELKNSLTVAENSFGMLKLFK
jgi:hypothetical protein